MGIAVIAWQIFIFLTIYISGRDKFRFVTAFWSIWTIFQVFALPLSLIQFLTIYLAYSLVKRNTASSSFVSSDAGSSSKGYLGSIQTNLQIERAIEISKNILGIDPTRLLGGHISPLSQEWRASLKPAMKEMNLNDEELAVLMCSPFAPLLRGRAQYSAVRSQIKDWENDGVIRDELAAHFIQELDHGKFYQ